MIKTRKIAMKNLLLITLMIGFTLSQTAFARGGGAGHGQGGGRGNGHYIASDISNTKTSDTPVESINNQPFSNCNAANNLNSCSHR